MEYSKQACLKTISFCYMLQPLGGMGQGFELMLRHTAFSCFSIDRFCGMRTHFKPDSEMFVNFSSLEPMNPVYPQSGPLTIRLDSMQPMRPELSIEPLSI